MGLVGTEGLSGTRGGIPGCWPGRLQNTKPYLNVFSGTKLSFISTRKVLIAAFATQKSSLTVNFLQ